MPTRHRSSLLAWSAIVCVISAAIPFGNSAIADGNTPDTPLSTRTIRDQIQQQQKLQQTAEKQLALKQAALQVAEGRMADLRKQLDEAVKRVESEKSAAAQIQKDALAIRDNLTALNESLKKHEAADAIQKTAAEAAGRYESIVAARTQLETQLAGLRKSAVEFQSRTVESEQKVQALEGQREALKKAATEARTAQEAAQKQLTAADAALATAKTALATATNSLTAEQQRLDAASVASGRLMESVSGLQKSLNSLKESAKVMGANPEEAIKGLSTAIADLQALHKNATTLVQQLTTRRDALKPQVATAEADVQKKQSEQTAATQALTKATEATSQADAKIAALNSDQEALKVVIAESRTQQQAMVARIQSLEPSIQKLTAELQLVRSDTVALQRKAETALEPLGRFVSFSRHVAPILSRRCIACHNTRSPGGRLNLDTFAALTKGGESGAAFEPHKSADSLLLTMVEDGSMPKEADPLTKAEIDAIRQWIDVGAPLDAGLLASAELFDVIPEAAQPLPPASYRVPIPVTATAFSPDGSQLATSGYHEVLIWKTDDGSLVRRISNVAERVYDIEFSRDGQAIAVAAGTPGQLGEVKLFSAADGSFLRTLVRAKDAVFAVSFSPDGTRLASAGADRTIVVAKVADGEQVIRIEDHADWVMDINWSPDGAKLVSSSRDKTSKVFDAQTGDPQITFSGHGEPVYTAAFLSDGKTVVSGGGDKKLRLWNTADAKEARAITGFGGDVFRVVVAAGDHILSASADRNAREHNAADGKVIRTLSGHTDWVYTLSLNVPRNLIVTGSYDGEIRVWNSQDGAMQTSFIAIPKDMPPGSITASTR